MLLRRIAPALVFALGLLSVSARAETIHVTISNLAFSPAEVNAKVGDSIEWVNNDPFVHTATARNGDWNVAIAPKQTQQVVLKKPGAVDYYCTLHPNMKGRVTVVP
jgi:plastocyanin